MWKEIKRDKQVKYSCGTDTNINYLKLKKINKDVLLEFVTYSKRVTLKIDNRVDTTYSTPTQTPTQIIGRKVIKKSEKVELEILEGYLVSYSLTDI